MLPARLLLGTPPLVSDTPEAGLYEGLASLASPWQGGWLSNGQFIASYYFM
jgi:hypothetical protein